MILKNKSTKQISALNTYKGFVAVLVLVGLGVFIALTTMLTSSTVVAYDAYISNYFVSIRSSGLTNYFVFITHVGDVYGYLTLILAGGLFSIIVLKQKKRLLQIILTLALSALLNVLLKHIINRARPAADHLVSVQTLSYPSGHAMNALVFYGFIMYLVSKLKINRFVKIGVILVLACLILSIGLSRIYLGVHFPSDILGGFIIGATWLVLCISVFNLIEIYKGELKL
ncbi:phosphatase PAP2 family protein [Oceanihabitans sp. IOP_32]|uniref:phosphatase PAP2 family protein n=1 Tax=Oceanihabitans sp. IOP_32 TaxID=2529032 RepID=UPI001D173FB9|nr:phosphatase PAP2 family protein [Oceanihabitans sp. IOP_32]